MSWIRLHVDLTMSEEARYSNIGPVSDTNDAANLLYLELAKSPGNNTNISLSSQESSKAEHSWST